MSQDCRNVFLSPGYARILKYISTGNAPGDFKGGNLHLSQNSCVRKGLRKISPMLLNYLTFSKNTIQNESLIDNGPF